MPKSDNSPQNNLRYLIKQVGFSIALIICLFYAVRSISENSQRQMLLRERSYALHKSLEQATDLNQELKQGLNNYLSSYGMERLARERLNLAGKDEVVVRIVH